MLRGNAYCEATQAARLKELRGSARREVPAVAWLRKLRRFESCGAVQASTKGICRRCLLEHLGALVGAGCNDTDLTAETACAGAVDGRNHNATACDRAFTGMCGAVANTLAPCEECVIDHAAEFIVGWGCDGDITSFCDQQE